MKEFLFKIILPYFIFESPFVKSFEYCSNFEIQTNHSYHPLRHCQRANGTIIGMRNVKSLDECVSFAKDRSALALNYRSNYKENVNRFDSLKSKDMNNSWSLTPEQSSRRKIQEVSEEFYNCQLLECPEYGNFSGMINDTRFDYYSLYTSPPRKILFR